MKHLKVYRVPQRAIWLWTVRLIVAFCGVVAVLEMFHVKQNLIFAAITAMALVSLAVVFYLWIYRKNYAIVLTPAAITVKSGVIIRKERILPFPRLIFTEIYATPIEKALKLEVIAFRAVRKRLFTMPISTDAAVEILGEITGKR